MDLKTIHFILDNNEKYNVFYNNRHVWIQGVDDTKNIAKIGFVDNFEEEDVYIQDLYEKNI